MKALALAGDLTIYGKRDDILLVRTVDGKIEKARVDILRSDFMDSPYYNLKQRRCNICFQQIKQRKNLTFRSKYAYLYISS